ncbi:hypothetical protein GCM10028791_40170 [Echinicola sediminis]
MKFVFQIILKLTFLASLVPYLVSEKVYQKYHWRINSQVEDSLYYGRKGMGEVDSNLLNEASGLASSRKYDNVLYTHNDSGGLPVIYKMDTTGKTIGQIHLKGTSNRDWEDIAVGAGPENGKSYIYVGEIGDNQATAPNIKVLRFEEPHGNEDTTWVEPDIMEVRYPEGARDAETLMVDPWNGDVLIVSKRDSSNVLYRLRQEESTGADTTELEEVMKLPITMSVAGDISPDGKEIIIKNYWVIYHWTREEGESLEEALSRKPVQLPYIPEPQGEAVAFSRSGQSYFTLSEEKFRVKPVLYQYHKK